MMPRIMSGEDISVQSFFFCHYIAATDSDREAMARTNTPLSFSTHSEFRLGEHGDPRRALLKARAAGVSITLSSDATSIAPPNMFENMRIHVEHGNSVEGHRHRAFATDKVL